MMSDHNDDAGVTARNKEMRAAWRAPSTFTLLPIWGTGENLGLKHNEMQEMKFGEREGKCNFINQWDNDLYTKVKLNFFFLTNQFWIKFTRESVFPGKYLSWFDCSLYFNSVSYFVSLRPREWAYRFHTRWSSTWITPRESRGFNAHNELVSGGQNELINPPETARVIAR